MNGLSDNRKALGAFITHKAEFDAMLSQLTELSDNHFGYAPDEINWGHVGTMVSYAELLKRITDAAFLEGDVAAWSYGAKGIPSARL